MSFVSRYWKWCVFLVGVGWAIFAFISSNSPDEVKKRADEWLSIPLIGQILSKIGYFAASSWVLAASFFLLGAGFGWWCAKRQKAAKITPWWQSLSHEMTWMAHRINEIDSSSNYDRLNADLNVLAVKVSKQGLPFPTSERGFDSFQSLLPYLNQVGAYLEANEIDHARGAATRLSQKAL